MRKHREDSIAAQRQIKDNKELSVDMLTVQAALAELAEMQLQGWQENQLALAELAETLLGGEANG